MLLRGPPIGRTITYCNPFVCVTSQLLAKGPQVVQSSLCGQSTTVTHQLPAPNFGTVYRHVSEMRTYRIVGSDGQ